MTEVHVVTGTGKNEFSYEDIGTLRLYTILTISFGILFGLMINSFIKYLKVEKTWLAPHPFVIGALAFQLVATFFQMLHLWLFSGNGEGSLVLDVMSKLSEAASESTTSLILFLLASGWKL